jgi:hypothetical protein
MKLAQPVNEMATANKSAIIREFNRFNFNPRFVYQEIVRRVTIVCIGWFDRAALDQAYCLSLARSGCPFSPHPMPVNC